MGFCSSYSEVKRFEETLQDDCVATDVLADDIAHTALLFAADNVGRNITLDGKGTFHGMGMIASITSGRQTSHTVLRRKNMQLNIVGLASVDIKEYRFEIRLKKYKIPALTFLEGIDHKIDVLWEMCLTLVRNDALVAQELRSSGKIVRRLSTYH